MVHNLLGGQIVAGKQEKLISEDLFLEVNGIMAQNTQGYSTNPENEAIPLKRFLKCDGCGQYLRGYKAKKNQKYYYMCTTKGCNCNRRADVLHERFRAILSGYSVQMDEDTTWAMREQMIATYNQLNEEGDKEREAIGKEVTDISNKLERLEERYIMEEITREMYEKYSAKFKTEKQELTQRMGATGTRVLNLENCVDSMIEFSSKLATVWDSSDYKGRQELQFWVFPEGIYYSRKNEGCRTERVNEVFAAMAGWASLSANEKTGNNQEFLKVPGLVPLSGTLSNQFIEIIRSLASE